MLWGAQAQSFVQALSLQLEKSAGGVSKNPNSNSCLKGAAWAAQGRTLHQALGGTGSLCSSRLLRICYHCVAIENHFGLKKILKQVRWVFVGLMPASWLDGMDAGELKELA